MSTRAPQDILRLKRHAVQIATQLPENREDALRVLEFAREIVEWEDGGAVASVLKLIG